MRKTIVIIVLIVLSAASIYPAKNKNKKNTIEPRISEEQVFYDVYKNNKDKILLLKTRDGTGSGFISDEGFIVTANHVVGTSPYTEFTYNNIVYVLKPCYRNHEEDIAILYPIGFMNSFNRMENIDFDFFKNKSLLQLKNIELKTNDAIVLLGYPYGLMEVKRIIGKYKETRVKYDNKIPLYACDLPVIRGCSGGPVFNIKGEIIGTAVSFETQPTDTEYLVSYVTPNYNILNSLKNINKDYIDRIKSIGNKMPSFDMDEKNIRKPRSSLFKSDNISFDSDKNVIYNKSGDGRLIYEDRALNSVNIFFDLFLEAKEASENKDSYFELIIKKNDEKNFVSFVIDFNRNNYFIKYVTNGVVTNIDAFIKMPFMAKSEYNVEIYVKGSKFGVFFDNLPIYYDLDLPYSTGVTGFEFKGVDRIYIDKFLLRIPD